MVLNERFSITHQILDCSRCCDLLYLQFNGVFVLFETMFLLIDYVKKYLDVSDKLLLVIVKKCDVLTMVSSYLYLTRFKNTHVCEKMNLPKSY